METLPGLPPLPSLGSDPQHSSSGLAALPFPLPDLELKGSKKVYKSQKLIPVEEEDDPGEEAQMIQLLQQIQRVKESKEKKRKRGEVAAKASRFMAGVKRQASKHAEKIKAKQATRAGDIRNKLDLLHESVKEECRCAETLKKEHEEALKAARDVLIQKHDEVAEAWKKLAQLRDCIRQHYDTVEAHVTAQIECKISETEEVVEEIQAQPDNMLSIFGGAA